MIFDLLRTKFNKKKRFIPYIWGYDSFKAAAGDCSGYSEDNILKATQEALLKVKNGIAVFERDTVIFDKIEYSWPLLSSLLYVALRNNGKFNILDFGGSLGSTYYQNRKFLLEFNECWGIVEQIKHVQCGKKYFEDDCLKFYNSISDFILKNNPDVILFSSVLHYLENPVAHLKEAKNSGFKYIIIDRTPVISTKNDLYAIQNVPESIYRASIPMRVFSESCLLENIMDDCDLVEDWISTIDGAISIPGQNENAVHKGYLFAMR